MSRPYYDDHSRGIPQYYHPEQPQPQQPQQQPHPPPSPRHRPAAHNASRIPQPVYTAPDRRRIQKQMNPAQSTAAPPGRAQRQTQPPHNSEQSAWEVSQNLYDATGYEYPYGQHDQWPLPAHPSPQPRAHASPNVNSSPRKPPRRPRRPDESPSSENRQPIRNDASRASPRQAELQYSAPPQQASHHGNGQWTGDGYAYAAPMYPPPSRPLPPTTASAGQPAIPQYVSPPVPQQAVYGHANRRPPLGPPPSARRGPPNYYPQVAPVHPIAEETDSMRGSTKTGSVRAGDHNSKTSFASSNAIPIGIPQFYVDEGSARPSTGERSTTTGGRASPSIGYGETDDQSVDGATERRLENFNFDDDNDGLMRDQHSPVLVRQASLGKRSKPTLVTQKSGDHMRKSSDEKKSAIASLLSKQDARKASRESTPTTFINTEHGIDSMHSRAIAKNKLDDGQAEPGAHSTTHPDDSHNARDAAAAVAAVPTAMSNDELKRDGAHSKTPEEILKSGTGLLDASSADESEHELKKKKKRSRELLGATVAKELHPERYRTRSPLAPRDDERVKSILESLEKGGAISTKEVEELKQPMAGLSDRNNNNNNNNNKRRPPRLDVDAVRNAEARGSLTSLPDLIKRATKLASNLDRGKTASRLGMANWLDGAPDAEKKHRSGSISDMLAAFPPPNMTPTGSRTGWRNSRLRHSELPSDSDAGGPKKKGVRRRCCGMSLWVFIVVMILLFFLIAAAVVVPVMLLVVVPNRNNDNADSKTTTKLIEQCQRELTCDHNGTNVLDRSGHCECLCTKGYTGPTCSSEADHGCTSISIGSTANVSIGTDIPPLFQDAANTFNISLNAKELTGKFSQFGLTCDQQNALISFNGASRSKRSSVVSVEAGAIKRRQEPATTNGIVSATGTPTTATGSRVSGTATSSGAGASSTGTVVDDAQAVEFARVAVLYVLQTSGQLDPAADAQTALQGYFRGNAVNGHPIKAQNVTLGSGFSCDLIDYTINSSDGTTVGGPNGKPGS